MERQIERKGEYMVSIAVLGYGTVGSGVVEVLKTNRESINKRAGKEINLKYILDLKDFPGDPIENILVKDYEVIVNDPEIKVVVEVMGGVNPAYQFVKKALQSGKSVCTSNKELVAKHGAELLSIAKQNKINFLFEASVGGGIPIIRPLNQSLTADEIEEITGILNGTTNYMLTRMADEGVSFEEVLKDAQAKGYAEADPTADVEGFDPCRKIAILTSLVCGQQVDYQDIYTEGITKITSEDFAYASQMDCSIKLLASSKAVGSSYRCMVAPFMLPKSHPLCNVNDVFNGVFVHGNMLGDAMFYGSGAGKLPTASAVVADIVDMVKHADTNIHIDWKPEKLQLIDYKESQNRFFVRTTSAKEEVAAVFGNVAFVKDPVVPGENAFTTDAMSEADFAEKAEKIAVVNRVRLA